MVPIRPTTHTIIIRQALLSCVSLWHRSHMRRHCVKMKHIKMLITCSFNVRFSIHNEP